MKVRPHATANLVIALIVGFALAACDQADLSEGGVFVYAASDSSGAVLVTGTLDLEFAEESGADGIVDITGTWQLLQSDAAATVGPQTGSGDLEGSVDEKGSLWLNLNPGWADNNVFLAGVFAGERFADFDGTWSYSTFAGPVAGGAFTALRK